MIMADSSLTLAFQFSVISNSGMHPVDALVIPKDWASHDNTLLPKKANSL